MYVWELRGVLALRGPSSRGQQFVDLLTHAGEEFRPLWSELEVGPAYWLDGCAGVRQP